MMRNLKAYLAVCLFSCLGFVLGFAVCHTFFTPPVSEHAAAAASTPENHLSPSTNQSVQAISRGAANEPLPSNNTGWLISKSSPKEDATDKKELFTLVHPTFPPTIIATFDPLEEVAKQLRNTNR